MEGTYYNTKESVEEYIKLSKDVNGNNLIKELEALLPKDSSVLEIGSGPGTDWNLLNKIYDVVGSDNSDEFIKYLTATNPENKFLKLDAISLNTNLKFDAIYSNKVLHHLKTENLIKSVKRQYELLNTNGLICHSFWKGEGSEIFKGLFVNYHNKQDLVSTFQDQFEIIRIEEYKEFEAGDSLLLIAKKK